VTANCTVTFQLKNGQYRADLAVRLADDLLPVQIKDRARAVVEKCRTAADGERLNKNFMPHAIQYEFPITPSSPCFKMFFIKRERKI
jgi:hypothetical protein